MATQIEKSTHTVRTWLCRTLALAIFMAILGLVVWVSRNNSTVPASVQTIELTKHPGNLSQNVNDSVCVNLGRLEQAAGQKFDGAMQFFDLPGDDADTSWHADSIRTFASSGLPLLGVYEPHGDTTRLLDAAHQKQLRTYFAGLHKALQGEQATFVVMPEPQAGAGPGAWQVPSPTEYANLVANLSGSIKQTNPNVRVAALLDLNSDDPSYAKALGLLPKGTVDTLVLQAFANGQKINIADDKANLSNYLNTNKALAYIRAAGNLPTMINTGIPGTDTTVSVSYSSSQRAAIARALIAEALALRLAGADVLGFNLFAQDKTASEQINWDFTANAAQVVVGPFIEQANRNGLVVYGFSDSPD